GIKPKHQVVLLAAPLHIPDILGNLPEDVVVVRSLCGSGKGNVIVLFAQAGKTLPARFAAAKECLTSDGGLWVAWPKKTSGVKTDLNENLIRAIGLAAGLVDNKVCAIDETWSGLRFVWRLKDRPKG